MDDIRADEPAWQCPVCNNKLHDTEDRGRVSMGIPWAVVLMMQGLSGTRGVRCRLVCYTIATLAAVCCDQCVELVLDT